MIDLKENEATSISASSDTSFTENEVQENNIDNNNEFTQEESEQNQERWKTNHNATLIDSPITSNDIRIIPSLDPKRHSRFVRLSAIDIEEDQNRHLNNSDSLNFDVYKLPLACAVESSLTKESFSNIQYLCNGSHSNIFKATYNDKPVILKVLIDTSLKNKVALKEFDREINMLSRMNHPNVLSLIGHGYVKSKLDRFSMRPLIALESLTGETLAYHLSKVRSTHVRPFTEPRVLRMAKDFASALYYIHEQLDSKCTLIHRDLKPDNIGFTQDGVLKLLDFGLCVCLNKNTIVDHSVYQLTGCTGSLRYMAPEVALSQPYNEKVDVYGFGLILYEIITGIVPFGGSDKDSFYKEVVNADKRPSLEYDDYGKEVKAHPRVLDLIQQCWDPLFTNRPTAKEAVDILTQQESIRTSNDNQKGFIHQSIQRVFTKKDSI